MVNREGAVNDTRYLVEGGGQTLIDKLPPPKRESQTPSMPMVPRRNVLEGGRGSGIVHVAHRVVVVNGKRQTSFAS